MSFHFVLVGNGPIIGDYNELVENADVVVRFNTCPSMATGRCGRKIDIICMTDSRGNGPRIWREREQYRHAFTHAQLRWMTTSHEHGPEIIPRLDAYLGTTPRPAVFFPQSLNSSGNIALRRIMAVCPEARITLIGFTFEGWSRHPWTHEKNYALTIPGLEILP